MSYSNRKNSLAAVNVTGTSTFTASAAVVTNTNVGEFTKYKDATRIIAVRVRVVTAPAAGTTTTKVAFLNGTSTFAVATIGTLTADQFAEGDADVNGRIAADVSPTCNIVSTGTASSDTGVVPGVFNVWFLEE